MKVTSVSVLILSVALGLVLGAGDSQAGDKPRFGEAIDPHAPHVTLAELLAKPDAYDGKTVVVEGRFAGACGDGDFFFKDKFDLIEADPPTPAVTSLKKGTPIRLYGVVKVHRMGASEESEQGEAAQQYEPSEPTTPGQVYVKIIGKAVEVK